MAIRSEASEFHAFSRLVGSTMQTLPAAFAFSVPSSAALATFDAGTIRGRQCRTFRMATSRGLKLYSRRPTDEIVRSLKGGGGNHVEAAVVRGGSTEQRIALGEIP